MGPPASNGKHPICSHAAPQPGAGALGQGRCWGGDSGGVGTVRLRAQLGSFRPDSTLCLMSPPDVGIQIWGQGWEGAVFSIRPSPSHPGIPAPPGMMNGPHSLPRAHRRGDHSCGWMLLAGYTGNTFLCGRRLSWVNGGWVLGARGKRVGTRGPSNHLRQECRL